MTHQLMFNFKPLSNLENINIKPFADFWGSSECTWWRETNRWCSRSWCTGWRRGWYQQTELSERSPTAGPSHTAGDTNTQTSLWVTVCSDLTEGKMSTCNMSATCFHTLLRKETRFLNTVLNMKESIGEESVYLTAGGVVQRTGGEASQVTEVLKEIQARHADGLWLQLRHLQTHKVKLTLTHTNKTTSTQLLFRAQCVSTPADLKISTGIKPLNVFCCKLSHTWAESFSICLVVIMDSCV